MTSRQVKRRVLGLTFLGIGIGMGTGAVNAAQVVAPPVAQAWIDIATMSGMGMPMGGMPGMGALGGLFGGGGQGGGNSFGNTRGMGAGQWVDVTLHTRTNPNLDAAQQAVPAGFLNPALELRTPKNAPPAPTTRDDEEIRREDPERPKGRMLLYWGCGSTIKPGQPRVLDMATASPADFGKFFVGRSATQRGAHSAVGRPVWPSADDNRMVPAGASLVGEHSFTGQGVPDGFRFQIPAAQDLMPPLNLSQSDKGGATDLSWNAIDTARAYFVAAMGANEKEDMVMWTSSELADTGFGLLDYQTNAAVDRWLKEKILLAPKMTTCTVPNGVFGETGGMLRLIAYGDELNLAHPPRPKDPKIKWEPIWAVKLRVKSVTMGMLGMSGDGAMGSMGSMRGGNATEEPVTESESPAPAREESSGMPKLPQALDLLKGIFGR